MEPTVYIAVAAMGGLGFFFAGFLVLADKKLRVEEDPLVERIIEELPNTNCGACGYAGCLQLAEKMSLHEVGVNGCPAGGQEVSDNIAAILGVESVAAEKVVAVLLCGGGTAEAKKNADYRGERSCVAADLTGGSKACIYGCHGFGDCVSSCNFGAMDMDSNGLPVIFYDKCVGCGACARECPRDLIEMHPVERKLFVYCKNRDKGPAAKKACTVACIGCTLCVKLCSVEGGIAMKDNLAVIDYELCPQDSDAPTTKCPTKCILLGAEEGVTRESYYASVKDAC
ncbi:MAG: RnfABCDGE type electron transport complex subunit B [Thermodesulfobacteriota bacterium]